MQKQLNQESSRYINYENRLKLNRGYHEFIDQYDFEWHVTANFNRETTHQQGRKIIKNWSARVDRKLHGRNFHRKTIDNRLFFFAIPEIGGKSGYLHYHIVAKLPVYSNSRFPDAAEAEWKQLVRTGQLYIQEIEDPHDLGRVIGYDLKDISRNIGHQEIIISTEFAPMH